MATKAARMKVAHEESPGFTTVFESLKAILVPYAGNMRVVHDTPDYYYLDTTFPVYRGKPAMFAMVKTGQRICELSPAAAVHESGPEQPDLS